MNDLTRQDIEKLKKDWLKDPCWDIEDTEGFEACREELRVYREEQEAIWDAQAEKRIIEKRVNAAQKKCPLISQPCVSDGCAWWIVLTERCAMVELPSMIFDVASVISDSQPPASYYR